MKIILIPNYYVILSHRAKLKLKNFFEYSRNISFAYYSKTKNNFYNKFSLISYNPYMFQKYYSSSNNYTGYRRCCFLKYVILYKVYDNYVKISNIFYAKSNYSKIV